MKIYDKSVLGSPFDDFVRQQFDTRVKLMSTVDSSTGIPTGNISRDSQNINYQIGKTGFARLVSAVDIDLERAKMLGKEEWQGSNLAKNFILQAGTLTESGQLRGGLNVGDTYTLGGIGDFGLRPMPGIESVTVQSIGRWGSLRKINIKIKCYNRNQLSIIETLYMRPGYDILLEWGHTLFHNNKNNLVTNIRFIDFFEENISRNKIYKKILEKQEQYSGNYDAFCGPVNNFDIKHNPDGTYDCSVIATSFGAVIESLKINGSSNDTKKLSDFVVDQDEFSKRYPKGFSNTKGDAITQKNEKEIETSKLVSILKSYIISCTNGDVPNDGKNHRIYIKDIYQRDFDTDITGHSNNINHLPENNVDPNELVLFSRIPFQVTSNNSISPLTNVYISLGSLLSVISKNCLLYNNDSKDPIININFNINENTCFSPEHHISIDPEVCLIKYEGPDNDVLGLKQKNNINNVLPVFKISKFTGRTMNIMININYVINIINNLENSNPNREVNLLDFLNKLVNGITLALGRVNEFNVGIDDLTNTLTIYDKQMLDVSPREISIINSTGLKSSVRGMSINTKIDNKLSSLIAIGAAASGVAIGTDASVLSEYNRGLTDRVFARKSEEIKPEVNLQEYMESLKSDPRTSILKSTLQQIYNNKKIITENINKCKNIFPDILNTIKAKTVETKGISIIPFYFNINMDGISGIKYGQLFSIEPTRLPKNYLKPDGQPFVCFLVTGINHTIQNNTWTTTIEGQASPMRNARIKV